MYSYIQIVHRDISANSAMNLALQEGLDTDVAATVPQIVLTNIVIMSVDVILQQKPQSI